MVDLNSQFRKVISANTKDAVKETIPITVDLVDDQIEQKVADGHKFSYEKESYYIKSTSVGWVMVTEEGAIKFERGGDPRRGGYSKDEAIQRTLKTIKEKIQILESSGDDKRAKDIDKKVLDFDSVIETGTLRDAIENERIIMLQGKQYYIRPSSKNPEKWAFVQAQPLDDDSIEYESRPQAREDAVKQLYALLNHYEEYRHSQPKTIEYDRNMSSEQITRLLEAGDKIKFGSKLYYYDYPKHTQNIALAVVEGSDGDISKTAPKPISGFDAIQLAVRELLSLLQKAVKSADSGKLKEVGTVSVSDNKTNSDNGVKNVSDLKALVSAKGKKQSLLAAIEKLGEKITASLNPTPADNGVEQDEALIAKVPDESKIVSRMDDKLIVVHVTDNSKNGDVVAEKTKSYILNKVYSESGYAKLFRMPRSGSVLNEQAVYFVIEGENSRTDEKLASTEGAITLVADKPLKGSAIGIDEKHYVVISKDLDDDKTYEALKENFKLGAKIVVSRTADQLRLAFNKMGFSESISVSDIVSSINAGAATRFDKFAQADEQFAADYRDYVRTNEITTDSVGDLFSTTPAESEPFVEFSITANDRLSIKTDHEGLIEQINAAGGKFYKRQKAYQLSRDGYIELKLRNYIEANSIKIVRDIPRQDVVLELGMSVEIGTVPYLFSHIQPAKLPYNYEFLGFNNRNPKSPDDDLNIVMVSSSGVIIAQQNTTLGILECEAGINILNKEELIKKYQTYTPDMKNSYSSRNGFYNKYPTQNVELVLGESAFLTQMAIDIKPERFLIENGVPSVLLSFPSHTVDERVVSLLELEKATNIKIDNLDQIFESLGVVLDGRNAASVEPELDVAVVDSGTAEVVEQSTGTDSTGFAGREVRVVRNQDDNSIVLSGAALNEIERDLEAVKSFYDPVAGGMVVRSQNNIIAIMNALSGLESNGVRVERVGLLESWLEPQATIEPLEAEDQAEAAESIAVSNPSVQPETVEPEPKTEQTIATVEGAADQDVAPDAINEAYDLKVFDEFESGRVYRTLAGTNTEPFPKMATREATRIKNVTNWLYESLKASGAHHTVVEGVWGKISNGVGLKEIRESIGLLLWGQAEGVDDSFKVKNRAEIKAEAELLEAEKREALLIAIAERENANNSPEAIERYNQALELRRIIDNVVMSSGSPLELDIPVQPVLENEARDEAVLAQEAREPVESTEPEQQRRPSEENLSGYAHEPILDGYFMILKNGEPVLVGDGSTFTMSSLQVIANKSGGMIVWSPEPFNASQLKFIKHDKQESHVVEDVQPKVTLKQVAPAKITPVIATHRNLPLDQNPYYQAVKDIGGGEESYADESILQVWDEYAESVQQDSTLEVAEPFINKIAAKINSLKGKSVEVIRSLINGAAASHIANLVVYEGADGGGLYISDVATKKTFILTMSEGLQQSDHYIEMGEMGVKIGEVAELSASPEIQQSNPLTHKQVPSRFTPV